ncbi:MAG: hypothetical protein WAN04_13275 [Candidatus Udaeobacter sp.]
MTISDNTFDEPETHATSNRSPLQEVEKRIRGQQRTGLSRPIAACQSEYFGKTENE